MMEVSMDDSDTAPPLLIRRRVIALSGLLLVVACLLPLPYLLLHHEATVVRTEQQQLNGVAISKLQQALLEPAMRQDLGRIEQLIHEQLQRSGITTISWRDGAGNQLKVTAGDDPSIVPSWFASWFPVELQQQEAVVAASGQHYGVVQVGFASHRGQLRLWNNLLLSLLIMVMGVTVMLLLTVVRLRRTLFSAYRGGGAAGEEYDMGSSTLAAHHQADERELRIASAAFEGNEGMMVTDVNGTIQRVNGSFTKLTGYSAAEVIGHPASLLKSGRQGDAFYKEMWQTLLSDHHWEGEIWNRRKNGEIFPEWLTISAVTNEEGNISHFVSSFSDLSERKEAEERIQYLAFYDPLTQLPNRRLLLDRLSQAIAASGRGQRWGAMLFIDLDHFKKLNDTRGHEVGDLLLIEVANRIQSGIREDDTVARLGGDEFVVILGNLQEERKQAAADAEQVAEAIGISIGQRYLIKGFEHYATASIGVTLFLGDTVSAQEMLQQADIAMYQAKSAGRNTVRFFDPVMQAVLDARLLMEGELRQALIGGELQLYYQLQVDSSDTVIGAEVLLRWLQPQRGMVPPGHFIPVAEDSGLIVPIGNWVLQSACARLKSWDDEPLLGRIQLAVNVSARQFRQPDFVEQVIAIMEENAISPSRLKLELTESMVLDDMAGSVRKMEQLKSYGVSFSMDDFGTGHSSLAYLKQLPLDQMKIDQSFVRDITLDPSDAVLVKTIIAMGRNLGLDVIAEGVETEAQRRYLEDHGCGAFQGYLFSRPLPVEQFELLVRARAVEPYRLGEIATE